MKKILCLFDYGMGVMTGYATVSKNIVAQVKKEFGDDLHLDIIAINYFGDPYKEYNDTVQVWPAKPLKSSNSLIPESLTRDDFGRFYFMNQLKNDDYDGIFILQDLGTVAAIIPLIKMIRDGKAREGKKVFKSTIYFPVDGPIQEQVKNAMYDRSKLSNYPKEMHQYFKEYIRQLDELDFFDAIVTYTEFGHRQIVAIRPSLKKYVGIIYHGMNIKEFYPMEAEEKQKFKRRYYGELADRYIIGVINRNQPRKDIPTAIFGYIEAASRWKDECAGVPKPFLYLHMAARDSLGWDLKKLLDSLKLQEGVDYMFPKNADHNAQVDVATLNGIYNSLDVYLNTSRGEGWGLTATEAMACGICCILPNHTSFTEIGKQLSPTGKEDYDERKADMLEEFLPVCDPSDNVSRYMCHFEEVAEHIIYSAAAKMTSRESAPIKKIISQRIENALEFIHLNTWDEIGKKWVYLFRQCYF